MNPLGYTAKSCGGPGTTSISGTKNFPEPFALSVAPKARSRSVARSRCFDFAKLRSTRTDRCSWTGPAASEQRLLLRLPARIAPRLRLIRGIRLRPFSLDESRSNPARHSGAVRASSWHNPGSAVGHRCMKIGFRVLPANGAGSPGMTNPGDPSRLVLRRIVGFTPKSRRRCSTVAGLSARGGSWND